MNRSRWLALVSWLLLAGGWGLRYLNQGRWERWALAVMATGLLLAVVGYWLCCRWSRSSRK